MKWHTTDETPHVFYDIVVKEPGMVYTRHIDSPSVKVRGDWAYAHELVREVELLETNLRMHKSMINALVQEMRYEANSSDDYSTRKRMEALINIAKFGAKKDEK